MLLNLEHIQLLHQVTQRDDAWVLGERLCGLGLGDSLLDLALGQRDEVESRLVLHELILNLLVCGAGHLQLLAVLDDLLLVLLVQVCRRNATKRSAMLLPQAVVFRLFLVNSLLAVIKQRLVHLMELDGPFNRLCKVLGGPLLLEL